MKKTTFKISSKNNHKIVLLQVIATLLSIIGMTASWAFQPYAFKVFIDSFTNINATGNVIRAIILLLIGKVIGQITLPLAGYTYTYLEMIATTDLRNSLFRHILSMPLASMDDKRIGDSMSCFTSSIPTYTEKYGSLGASITNIITFLLMLVVLAIMNKQLLWLVPAFGVIYIVLPYFLSKQLRQIGTDYQKETAQYNSILQESLSAIREIKALNDSSWITDRLKNCVNSLKAKKLRSRYVELKTNFLPYIFYYFAEAGAFLISIIEVQKGHITAGAAVASIMYIGNIIVPLQGFGGIFSGIRLSAGALDNITQSIDFESKEDNGTEELPNAVGNVIFDNVSFSYPNSDFKISDINIQIKACTKTALIGSNGSGKSTLGDLLLKFYNPISGQILIDNIDISKVKESSLRKHIGIIFQEPFLFNTTIKENIRFGRLDATDEEIVEASKIANAHDFIMGLPEGYNTALGERGKGLSGGQKQRIAIARVLLRNPQILILDEATSSLDKDSTKQFNEIIDKISQNKTVIIITHDLITASKADHIVVLDHGIIAEQGSHEQLLSNYKLYYELYNQQQNNTKNNVYKSVFE